jgi:raffinose/stachyose/melibiose transport system substrate-binding protein
MFKSKRLLALTIILVLATSMFFTGCSKKEEVSVETKKVEVDVFQFKVEIAKELENAARDYEAEHSDVNINIQTVGGGDDYGAALKARFQSGNEPDIYNVGGPQDLQDWATKLEDLSNEPWVEKALDGVLSGATMEGKVYALPFNIEGYGFIYNKGSFEAAGIDGTKIVDYASLEEAVNTLDGKIKSGELKDKYPALEAVFEYAAKETWVTGLHTSNVALSQEFPSSLDAYNSKSVEFRYGDSLKKLIDLQADYSSNGKTRGKLNAVDYSTQVEQGLGIERVAIIQQGNWVYGGVKSIDEKVADNLGILPMPIVGAKEDSIPVGVPMHWAINKDSDDASKAAAKDFLNWLYTSEKGKDYVVNKFYFIPALKGYENFDPQDSLGKAVKAYAEAGKTVPWVFMGYPTGWGMDMLGANIQKYLAGEMTWDELIKDSQERWEKERS